MAAAYVLSIHAPGKSPQTQEFSARRVLIGREAGDIVLADERCSAHHAELLFDGKSLIVRDLGSTNGTWVAGQRIEELAWATGGAVHIGDHVLTLQELRAVSPGPRRDAVGNLVLPSPLAGSVEAPSPVSTRGPASHREDPAHSAAQRPTKRMLFIALAVLFALAAGAALAMGRRGAIR
jgi:hypothetical protein